MRADTRHPRRARFDLRSFCPIIMPGGFCAGQETKMPNHPKVLVIDDDQDFRASLRSLLESQGYEVLEAPTGHEGLRQMLEHSPDVILLDVMMESTVEGYGVTHSLRYREEYARLRNVPIIMVSSIEESPDERFPMSAEVDLIRPDLYLTKPIDIDKLLELLKGVAA